MSKSNNHFCVIMAGGVGSRFWPKSTENSPKQFLDVLGSGRTLIQHTYDRFSALIPSENFLVVTNDKYLDLVKEQLPEIKEANILLEPVMRNTAPCMAYAIKKIELLNPNAIMVVTPADHLISKQDLFEDVIAQGIQFVKENAQILTIGIQPNRPNTGYGYIEYSPDMKNETNPVSVLEFKEKPNLETAKNYISKGNYSWNSGMFLWSLKTIKESFHKNAPEILALFEPSENVYNTDSEQNFINQVYSNCPSISLDYAILENANNVSVINTDIGWSDIGTWVSLDEHIEKSEGENSIISGKAIMDNSSGNIVSLSDDKIIVTKGVNNFVIVETDGVLMIVAKEFEQDIKELREKAGKKFGKEII